MTIETLNKHGSIEPRWFLTSGGSEHQVLCSLSKQRNPIYYLAKEVKQSDQASGFSCQLAQSTYYQEKDNKPHYKYAPRMWKIYR